MAKRQSKPLIDLKSSIFDLTTRQLRAEIRKRTASINVAINEYREAVKAGKAKFSNIVETAIRQMQEASASFSKRTGKVTIPKGRRGEIGLGLTYKTKSELQRQLAGLRRFEEKDVYTPAGKRKWEEHNEQSYQTFKDRYGEISREEYSDMVDTMNIIKNTLMDYGYEDYGRSLARMYTKSSKNGKRKFARYVDQAKREMQGQGKSTEDLLDRVAELLREDGEL